MFTIENDLLSISLRERGAELTSIYHKGFKMEYLWNGDPAFWAKQSPVLFPVVGGLKENTYFYRNRPYQLSRHGFAREKDFSVVEQTPESITFSLSYDDETLATYPFQFELRITYSVVGAALIVGYEVKNLMSEEEMYFSVGGHPAFKVPLLAGTDYEDYYLEFGSPETVDRWPISPDGLIDATPQPFLKNASAIALSKSLFSNDAIVFKNLQSHAVSLRCTKHEHGLDFHFAGFPYLGIWAARNADFVCVEPWCGIADSVNTDQQLMHKEGIHKLEKDARFYREWKIALY